MDRLGTKAVMLKKYSVASRFVVSAMTIGAVFIVAFGSRCFAVANANDGKKDEGYH